MTTVEYTGNQGVLGLNTYLAADGSPSDRLVVLGTAKGSSQLRITNASGPGDVTGGDGILVVPMGPGMDGMARSASE